MVKPFSVGRVLNPNRQKNNGEEEEERGGATYDPPKKQILREPTRFRSLGFSLPVLRTLRFLLSGRSTENSLDRFQRDSGADPGSAPSRSRHQMVIYPLVVCCLFGLFGLFHRISAGFCVLARIVGAFIGFDMVCLFDVSLF